MTFSNSSNDVFRTQADTRFNSFSEPMNAVNQNPGPWGVDSNYLTPSFMSPFRPQYQGPNGNTYGNHSPAWSSSINQIANPFAAGAANYGGNTWMQNSPFYDSAVNRPVDGAASFMQNWAVPGVASWYAYKKLGRMSTTVGAGLGRGMTAGLARGAFSASQAGTLAGWGAGLGGLAGNLFMPMMAAQGAVSAFDSAVMDPYIAQRQMGRSMRENFGGVNFSEGGDPFTGGGLSRRMAQNIAKQTSVAGAKDMTFTQQETAMLTDFASRSGMMDNASATQLSARFESILKQVKVVMAVANTSDFKEAIEMMSKMQMAGVGTSQLNGLAGKFGALSAAGGQSMMKVFNTVGTQGQYLFGAAGLTPYVGMQSAFGSNASMSAAYRSGLVSPAMMARMGGVEGASQSALGATIAAYQTPYANMMAHNAYFGGGSRNNVVGNLSAFGGHIAADPLSAIGNHELMGGALASRHIQDRGLMGEQDMIMQIAGALPNAIKNGKLDAGAAFMIMTNTMGMSKEQAFAKIQEFGSYSNKGTTDTMLAGTRRASIDSMLKYQQQERLDKGFLTTPYNAIAKPIMSLQAGGAGLVGDALTAVGAAGDKFQNAWNRSIYQVNDDRHEGLSFDSLRNKDANEVSIFNLDSDAARKLRNTGAGMNKRNDLEVINNLARAGNKDALTYLRTSGETRDNALGRLAKSGKLNAGYATSSAAAAGLAAAADSVGYKDVMIGGTEGNTLENTIGKGINAVLQGATVDQGIEYITLMAKVRRTMAEGGKVDDATKDKIRALMKSPGDLSDQRLGELSADAAKNAGAYGVYDLEGLGPQGSLANLAKTKQGKGMDVLAPKIIGSNDGGAVGAQSDLQMSIAQEKARIISLRDNMKIDTTSMMGAMNALDNQTAVGAFSDAVTRFSEAVNGVKESKPQTPYELANKTKNQPRPVR